MASKTLQSGLHLYNHSGERLYLSDSECARFLTVIGKRRPQIRLLCLVLYYTGIRISEALAIKRGDIQFDSGIVAIRSLKKRSVHHIREVHIPKALGAEIDRHSRHLMDKAMIFAAERSTAWRWISAAMKEAGIHGAQACPKGLRHAFGVRAVLASVPLPVLQKWMGHSRLETTTIYTRIMGPEERKLAEGMFKQHTQL